MTNQRQFVPQFAAVLLTCGLIIGLLPVSPALKTGPENCL